MQSTAIATELTAALPVLRFPRLRLLRPRQWVKNAFVLAPLIFSGSFLRGEPVVDAVAATLLFCLASSATYVLNDLRDRDADRRHPTKRHKRPIAAGLVSVGEAKVMLGVLVVVLAAGGALMPRAGAVIAAYLLLNVGYSLGMKHMPVLDLFCIATGFVLRVYAGAVAISVALSSWMLITTLSLALYLATIKRRTELRSAAGDGGRRVLEMYTLPLLDRYAELAAVSAIVFYGLFVISVRPQLSVTVPLVLFGLFRYWYLVERNGGGESPTDALWGDLPLASTVVLWGAVCAYMLWPR
jgi:4-hydroxybenzoate polyprenyltransferase